MNRFITIVALLAILLVSGCVSPAAINACKVGQSSNKGHMNDASLTPKAKLIAQVSYDLFGQTLYALDGTAMPADTQARYDERQAAKESGE